MTSNLIPCSVIFKGDTVQDAVLLQYRKFRLNRSNLGIVATKPGFGVSDKVNYKPVCSATETS